MHMKFDVINNANTTKCIFTNVHSNKEHTYTTQNR
jgi:hypothetical protein